MSPNPATGKDHDRLIDRLNLVFSLAFGAGWNWGQVAAAALVVLGVIVAQGRGNRAP